MIKMKARIVRVLIASIVILAIFLGTAAKRGWGTICSLGAWRISFSCPLGFLQMALASRKLLPQLWLSVGLFLLLIVLFGRFFCAWVCPTALLQQLFGGKEGLKSRREKREGKVRATAQPRGSSSSRVNTPLEASPKGKTWASYSHYAVLGGTLLSSFLFGFPVFCAVCPIGLFFGTLFAVNRLLFAKQPSLELLAFPALLGLEIFVLRSWCRSICPLGALLSIVSSVNRFFRPTVNKDRCLRSQDVRCRACKEACPEGIDLLNDSSSLSLKDCTKCLECYEKCPAKAIGLRLF